MEPHSQPRQHHSLVVSPQKVFGFEDFRIVGRLGEGSFGTVFLVEYTDWETWLIPVVEKDEVPEEEGNWKGSGDGGKGKDPDDEEGDGNDLEERQDGEERTENELRASAEDFVLPAVKISPKMPSRSPRMAMKVMSKDRIEEQKMIEHVMLEREVLEVCSSRSISIGTMTLSSLNRYTFLVLSLKF